MICPSCGHKNIQGDDFCANCNEDLAALDGISSPKTEIGRSLLQDPIQKLSPKKPVVVAGNLTLAEGIEKMNQSKIGCLLVMDGDKLQGIITERDILFKVLGQKKLTSPISEVMTTTPDTLEEDDSIAYALNKMSVRGYRHIPILKEGKASGIISIRDILRYISGHL
ncbi:MAG: CBS domain-containing protein [Deltaproteobacteria bacterium]|nr:CBS domain-containing protein [Deltaproteobacteria bacterium]